MDLNHIALPISTVVDFYGNVLVLPGAEEKPRTATRAPAADSIPGLPSLGGNAAHILVASRHTDATFLPDHELAFLTRILVPCKLSLDDVAIINLVQYPGKSGKEITSSFNSRKVILFGVSPVDFGLPVSFPEFQVQSLQGIDYVWAPALTDLEKEEVLKRKFWESLKKLFNLKAQ